MALPTLLSQATCGNRTGKRDSRPNILFICTDQFNASCAGYAGHPLVHTPNLDRLADRGTVFSNCYSNSPVCVPARAAMFSGLYPHEVESYDNAAPFDGRVPSWTNRLSDSGYACRATGKLDFFFRRDYGMHEVDTVHGHDLNPDITAYFRRPMVPRINSRAQIDSYLNEQPHRDTRFVAEARRFLSQEADSTPWVQYVGLHSPHPKWVVPANYYRMYNLENISLPRVPGPWPFDLHPVMAAANHYHKFDQAPFPEGNIRRTRAAYFAMITQLDQWVGGLLHALEKSGQAENTVVVFTADHGEMLGEHGMWFKSCAYDEAARVPLIIAGPSFGPGRVDAPVSHVDLAATMLELADLKPFEGMRGRSLLPLAKGEEPDGERWTYSELNNEGNLTGSFWIRKGDWKYIYFAGYEPLLFNLTRDPKEYDNLAGQQEYQPVQRELHRLLLSVADPEEVSVAAFVHQRARFEQDLAHLDDPDIYRRYSSRLGEEFAAGLKQRKAALDI